MSETELARREPMDALATIVGTGDTRAMLGVLEQNVRDIIAVARDRGFVRRYGDNQNEFYGLPAWQLLGTTYGLVPFIEWTRQVEGNGGYEARAVVRRLSDGTDVASAEAMCTRQEPNKRGASDHTLRAMAQTRAQRNALRSCLGAALVLAGFDFADPEGPATQMQVGVLHQLSRELEWPRDQAHEVAGVASFKDLSREQASELIDAWTQLRDDIAQQGSADVTTSPVDTSPAADPAGYSDDRPSSEGGSPEDGKPVLGKDGTSPGDSPPLEEDSDEPATAEQWARVPKTVKKVALIKLASKLVKEGRIPGPAPTSQSMFTKMQLAFTLSAYLDSERG